MFHACYLKQKKNSEHIAFLQGQLEEGVAHIRDLTTFIRILEATSVPDMWSYMEDEIFLRSRPELKADIGENVRISTKNFWV